MAKIKFTTPKGKESEIEVKLSKGLKIEGIKENEKWNLTTVNVDDVDFVSPHWGERPKREER